MCQTEAIYGVGLGKVVNGLSFLVAMETGRGYFRFMSEPGKYLEELVSTIEKDADADLYLYSGPVSPFSERHFNECLIKNKNRTNILCFVTTRGGSPDVAYQLVRSVRRNYPNGKFSLFVDSTCKSAGTLIALGCDEIVMSDTAELGPLDIQIQKPGELGELVSGLTSTYALNTLRSATFETFEQHFLQLRLRSGGAITTRMAAEIAARMVIGLFRPVYAQFDPMRLGENARSNQIAQEYGQRIKGQNAKENCLARLINEYPSHGFVIDRDEATTLFNRVRPPTESEYRIGKILLQVCRDSLDGDEPIIRKLKGASDGGGHDNEHDRNHGEPEESRSDDPPHSSTAGPGNSGDDPGSPEEDTRDGTA